MEFEYEEKSIEDLEEPLEFKGSYLFDFEKGEFVKNPDGTIAKSNDLEAYVQWCNKTMYSPRYKLAYSDLYGQEFNKLIGTLLSKDAIELEIKRMTEETLIVHPRTREITNFVFKWSDSKEEVFYEYEVITIDGERFMLENSVKVR
jgi:PAS domain-containing protein